MLKRSFIVLGLMALILASWASGENLTMTNTAFGSNAFNSWTLLPIDAYNPDVIYLQNLYSLFFYSYYAGTNNITIVFGNSSSMSDLSMTGMDCVGTTCSLVNCVINKTTTGAHFSVNTLCESNIGLYYFGGSSSAGDVHRSLSSIVNINKTERNFIAGSKYDALILKLFHQRTNYYLADVDDEIYLFNNSVFNSSLSSTGLWPGAYWGYMIPPCDASTENDKLIWNYVENNSDANQFLAGYYYINLSSIQDFTVKDSYPSSESTIYVNAGTTIDFYANPSYNDAVTATVWYSDHVINQITYGASGYGFSKNFTSSGSYLIEVQFEDAICNRYPLRSWTINVNNGSGENSTNTLEFGLQNSTLCNGVYTMEPIIKSDVQVKLYDNETTVLIANQSTDVNGLAYFYDVPNGVYYAFASYGGVNAWEWDIVVAGGSFYSLDLTFDFGVSGDCVTTTSSTSTTAAPGSSTSTTAAPGSSTSTTAAPGSSTTTTSTTTTTTTSTSTTSTTLNYNKNLTVSYDCSNLTGKMLDGDIKTPAMCSFIIPLGTVITFILFAAFWALFVYAASNSFEVTAFLTLLWIGFLDMFIAPVTLEILYIILSISFGAYLAKIYTKNHSKDKKDGGTA